MYFRNLEIETSARYAHLTVQGSGLPTLSTNRTTGHVEISLGEYSNTSLSDMVLDIMTQRIQEVREIGLNPVMIVQEDFANGTYDNEALTLTRLVQLGVEVKKGIVCDTVESNLNDEDYIALIAEAQNLSQDFFDAYFTLLKTGSTRIIKQHNGFVNVRIPVDLLEETVCKLTGRTDISRQGREGEFIDFCSLYKSYAHQLHDDARLVINTSGPGIIGFTYDHTLRANAQRITRKATSIEDKSRLICEWIQRNVKYDHAEAERSSRRGALETYRDRMAVCVGQAMLQVTMERLVGNKSYLAHCGKYKLGNNSDAPHSLLPRAPKPEYWVDSQAGEDHAFVATLREDGSMIYSDPTQKKFNFPPPSFELLSNNMILQDYNPV